jgi:hypothetical protein
VSETNRRAVIAVAVIAILLAIGLVIVGVGLYGQHGNPMADKFFSISEPIAILILSALLIWQSRRTRKP